MGKFSFKFTRTYEGGVAESIKYRGQCFYNPEDTIVSALQSKCLSEGGNPQDVESDEFIYFNGDCLARISVQHVKPEKTYTRTVKVGIMPTRDIPSELEDLLISRGFDRQPPCE